ncbi:MAG: bifunctional nuclease family protein [Dehalococcoidia bacterium]|nr:bifunctional nuclease family protein [Dehalococcoidia bacterium]
MIEMTIDSIRVSMVNYQHVVILKEKESDRYLPIWIGPAEADAISVKLQNMDMARPLTHDLLKSAIFAFESASGTAISRVLVNDLRADTFYAQIIFEFNEGPMPANVKFPTESGSYQKYGQGSSLSFVWQGKEHRAKVAGEWQESDQRFLELENGDGLIFEFRLDEATQQWLLTKMKLDSRPSDAIALAVRATTPIYVEESVLDKAGIILDRETGKPIPADTDARPPKGKGKGKVDEQELKKLSAFYDFINTLDLDDLGKHKS